LAVDTGLFSHRNHTPFHLVRWHSFYFHYTMKVGKCQGDFFDGRTIFRHSGINDDSIV
jgi:hypothetical protein